MTWLGWLTLWVVASAAFGVCWAAASLLFPPNRDDTGRS